MNNLSNFPNWDKIAGSLGSRVSESTKGDHWFDLEEFFCFGINHSINDSRTFTAFSYIVIALSPILAPFKVKKILESGTVKYDKALLGYFLDLMLSGHTRKQLAPLYKLAKSNKGHTYFKNFKHDERFIKWGNMGTPFNEPESKFLIRKKLLNNPLIRSRFEGVKPVFSDLKYYKDFHPNEQLNLYEIAKKTHHDYASIHKANKLVSQLIEASR